MCRWVKDVLRLSGVDISTFRAGSTRAAATSKATEQGAPLDVVMHTAGWTRESTFAKSIMKTEQLGEFILPQ